VTLSGGGVTTRILYMATCDKGPGCTRQGRGDCNTNPRACSSSCKTSHSPMANAKGIPEGTNNGGGGGRDPWRKAESLKVVNARFLQQTCAMTSGPTWEAARSRKARLSRRVRRRPEPVRFWIVNSTFGGKAGPRQTRAPTVGRAQQHRPSRGTSSTRCSRRTTAVRPRARNGRPGRQRAARSTTTATKIVLNITSSLLENNIANEGGRRGLLRQQQQVRGRSRSPTRFSREAIPRGTFETPDLPGFLCHRQRPRPGPETRKFCGKRDERVCPGKFPARATASRGRILHRVDRYADVPDAREQHDTMMTAPLHGAGCWGRTVRAMGRDCNAARGSLVFGDLLPDFFFSSIGTAPHRMFTMSKTARTIFSIF